MLSQRIFMMKMLQCEEKATTYEMKFVRLHARPGKTTIAT
jgi:hypothetical protein